MLKTFGWITYGIGLFIALVMTGLWSAGISGLIAAFVVLSVKFGQP